MSGDLARSLVDAAAAVFPVDPCAPDDGETVVDYELISTTEAERAEEINLPGMYSVPQWGPVEQIARAAVAAVLETLAAGIESQNWPMSVSKLRQMAAEAREDAV